MKPRPWISAWARETASCSPASVDSTTGEPFGPEFPTVTIRDIVRSQARLADHLGVDRWLAVVGGSMGGQRALEWAATYPERVPHSVIIAAGAAGIAKILFVVFLIMAAVTFVMSLLRKG